MKNILYPLLLILTLLLVSCSQPIPNPFKPHPIFIQERNEVFYWRFTPIKFWGVLETKHKNGKIESRIRFKHGVWNGISERFYDNGQLMVKVNFKNGVEDGVVEIYFDTGELKGRDGYTEGIKNGIHEKFYKNGDHEYKWNYINGLPDGEMFNYYESGELEILTLINMSEKKWMKRFYKNGVMTLKVDFDKDNPYKMMDVFDESGQVVDRVCQNYGEVIDNDLCINNMREE